MVKTIGVKPVGDRDFDKRFLYLREEVEAAVRNWQKSTTKADSYSAAGWLAPKQALNRAQLPYGFGMELIANGILPSEETTRGRRLSEREVDEFKSKYVSSVELAELLGFSTRKTIQAFQGEKAIASPPEFSGYIYNRAAALATIERLRSTPAEVPVHFEFDPEEHITASQISAILGINRDTITFLQKKGLLSSFRHGKQFYFSATE